MSPDPGETLMLELARALPAALDADGLQALAAKLRPYLLDGSAGASDGSPLMTAAEAARCAHVHVETVRRAIRAGDLAVAAWIGRSARIAPAAFDSWLATTSRRDRPHRAVRARRSTQVRHRSSEYSLLAALETTA
jgi:excisionase family DNA binding protein